MKQSLLLCSLLFACSAFACDKSSSTASTSTDEATSSAKKSATSTSSATPSQKTTSATSTAKPSATKVAKKKAEAPKAAVDKCGGPCPCMEGSKNKKDATWDRCTLSEAVTIQGYACAAGRVTFHRNGTLEECKLTADAVVDGHSCRKSPNSVKLHANGKLKACSASKASEIAGYKVAKYAGINLFDDGTPATAFLKEGSKDIDGYQCSKSLRFFKGGKLRMCTLTADATVGGEKVPSQSKLVLNQDGTIRGIWADGKVTYGKKTYDQKKRGNWLCFKNGKPDPEAFGCNRF
jgi:hypothetical protein